MNALDNEKIQTIIDEFGMAGYGYYFSLVELCAKKYQESGEIPMTFHIQTIRKVWRKNTQSCKKVLTKLQESGLFVATFSQHLVLLDIPNLTKYIGKYNNQEPNKERKKERKEINKETELERYNFLTGKTEKKEEGEIPF